ncbi:hypothetical protein ACHAXS_006815 [Conticribra weissflogii]
MYPNSNVVKSYVESFADASATVSQCDSHVQDKNKVKISLHKDMCKSDVDLDKDTDVSMLHSHRVQNNDQNDHEQNQSEHKNSKPPAPPSPTINGHSRTFPQILHSMLACSSNLKIVSWLPTGDKFVIYQPRRFAAIVLPIYFRKTSLESFVRKLKRWGFRRVKLPFVDHCRDRSDSVTYETTGTGKEVTVISAFEHKYFLKDNPRLCAKMFCRSHPGCSLEISCAVTTERLCNSGGVGGGKAGAVPAASAGVSIVSNCLRVIACDFGDQSHHTDQDNRPKERLFVLAEEPEPKQVKREAENDGIPTFLIYDISSSQARLDHDQKVGHEYPEEHVLPQHAAPGQPLYANNFQFLETIPFYYFPNKQHFQYHQQQRKQQQNYLLVHQSEMQMRVRMHWQREMQLQRQIQMQMQGVDRELQGHLPVPSSMKFPISMMSIQSAVSMPTPPMQNSVRGLMPIPYHLPLSQAIALDIDTTSNYLSQKQNRYPPLFCTTSTQESRDCLRRIIFSGVAISN